jgi:hypothetical protein
MLRAGLLRLGGAMLGEAMSADPGHRGPRADCGHGLAPPDDEPGVAGTSMSPGLAAMNDLAASAGPFAGAARLLEKLAGVRLTARQEGKGEDGRARTREVKLDADGYPVRDRASASVIATFEPANTPLEGIKKDEVGRELGYFLNNAPRMRYRWFRSRGLFVGSGVVEASYKTIVGQRLKQAGMHWTVAGADAIIALRCKEASSQREAICNHGHNQTGAA